MGQSHSIAIRYLFILALLIAAVPASCAVTSKDWGTTPEGNAKLFTLASEDLRVRVTEYGARLVSIETPDRNGKQADVVLGYSSLAQYVNQPKGYFGATVGRYANRIAKGTFTLDGTTYHVPLNNKGNALHGGPQGFSSRLWHGVTKGDDAVELTLVSKNGDMGFPGTLTVHVRYTLTGDRLRIDYTATTDKPTVINLTNHSYFNLGGEASGNMLAQKVRINADNFTPVDATLIPTGTIQTVQGTALDFRKLTAIGERISAQDPQLKRGGGYDHNYVVNGHPGTLREAAYAVDPLSGRTLTVLTTEPGVQFYSGNVLDGTESGVSGHIYQRNAGFCLETQHFPDSPNHPQFPSTVLEPGGEFSSSTVFVFSVSKL